nr:MAG TPA: hypothetical protein [Caudoviricetes sp.]
MLTFSIIVTKIATLITVIVLAKMILHQLNG